MPDLKTAIATAEDIPALQRIVDGTGLFPADMVPELLTASLTGETSGMWRVARENGAVKAFAYAVPEMLTEDTWNIVAIAVAPDAQGRGIGSALLQSLVSDLTAQNGRILLVETSSTEDFDKARRFYTQRGFDEEARIRDYWKDGDDKVTFRMSLR